MAEKPTFEELEKRVQELEKIESEFEVIKADKHRLEMILSSLDTGLSLINPDYTISWVNDTIRAIFPNDNPIGKTCHRFFESSEHMCDPCPTVEAYKSGRTRKMDKYNPSKDKWYSIISQPVKDESGQIVSVLEGITEITERKNYEQQILKEKNLLQQVMETSPVGITMVDEKGNISMANARAEEILGLERSDIYKRRYNDQEWQIADVLGNAYPDDQLPFELVKKTGKSVYGIKHSLVWPDGKKVFLSINAAPLLDSSGNVKGMLSTLEDITERKKTDALLREKTILLEHVTDNMSDMVSLADLEGRFVYVGKSHEKILGYAPEEMTGKSVLDFVHPDDRPAITEIFEHYLLTGDIGIVQYRYRQKDNHYLWLETIGEILVDENQNPKEIIFSTRDITDRKRVEAENEKLQAKLNQAQKMESVGRLAGGVAHDFNNMLGVILGHVELALEEIEANHDLHADLKEIQKAAQRSADLTKQLLTFARKQTISPRRLDLNDTVESMLNMLRRLIGENIDLVWKPAAYIGPIKIDPSQIDQILANLCVNARDAIAGVGKVTIETGRKSFDEEYCSEHPGFLPGDFALLAVSDNGSGMAKDTLDNLFEPFFTTKELGQGTGLGLATVYGIVKQNNGFISVYSEPGHGSTFKIYLPRIAEEEDVDKVVPDEKKVAAEGTETILLVEDEPSILRMARMMLERKGYAVLSAATPAEALEKAKNHSDSIELLMSDVIMPEMNGRDLAEKIILLYPEIRLLFMSGYTADIIANQGVLDEGVAFIQKPFSMADLTEKLRDVFGDSHG